MPETTSRDSSDRSFTSIRTVVGGADMHAMASAAVTDPAAPVFVLVHGLGMSSRYMMPTARELSARGNVYVPDLPGFGRSGRPREALTIPELADALAAWMTAMGIHRPVLIGNSLGAQVIVDFAVRHPSRLAAAVLIGLTIDPEARCMSCQIFRLLRDLPAEPVRLYGMGALDYVRAGFRRCLLTLRHALNDPVLDKLPFIEIPVLVMRGEKDPISPPRWNQQTSKLIPGAIAVTIPRAAHAVNFSAPKELARAVVAFLEPIP